jgi:superfamily I DNA/RNA helicase
MDRMIDEAQQTEPVRAAIMRVLAQRIFDQCASSYDP